MQPVVEAKDLASGYNGNATWQNANFSVRSGEFVAVIGPNGAGKTTLFKMLLGLQKPLKGKLSIFGEQPRRGNRRIGYVPQRHTIDNDTNIECIELVSLALSGNKWGLNPFSKNDKGAAHKILKDVGAEELANKSLAELSGGELQRIYLAEALVGDPDMLLLDEPLSNLDMKRTKDLVSLMSNVVRAREVTTFLVAHDINPLIHFLDKVIYIANGRVATGTAEEVLTSKRLTELYGTPVEVLRDSKGHILVHTLYDLEDYHEGKKHGF